MFLGFLEIGELLRVKIPADDVERVTAVYVSGGCLYRWLGEMMCVVGQLPICHECSAPAVRMGAIAGGGDYVCNEHGAEPFYPYGHVYPWGGRARIDVMNRECPPHGRNGVGPR